MLVSPEQHRNLHAHKRDEEQIQRGQRQAPLPARQPLGLRGRQPVKGRRHRQHVDGPQREPADQHPDDGPPDHVADGHERQHPGDQRAEPGIGIGQ
ncbi:Uncharacterised protein [Mycobacteroides abscessus subsp. massiliense]|nr:Uncharacterised protein [Mycobacteroides abscessus subsp. massiliense]